MNDDEWYFTVGGCLGVIPAVTAFFGSWWYCADTYGYLLGFGLGWLPSIILAALVFLGVRFLWGLGLAGAALVMLPQIPTYFGAKKTSAPYTQKSPAFDSTIATNEGDEPWKNDPIVSDETDGPWEEYTDAPIEPSASN